ncbi:hypothetical protein QOZ80_3AG0234860 [Eleusine coracana subsp. coracana]|nr:hypothetical protein QOZ80_3AG0234860 [Eleusine coracana subsp. coracana]
MAPMTATIMVKAVVVAVLLMQCCNVILAARLLLDVAAGDGGRWLGQDGALIMQILEKGTPSIPGTNPISNSGVKSHC